MKAFAVLLAFVVACSAVDYYAFECGNNIVEGSETCDPPQTGCGPTCQVLPGYECYYSTSTHHSVCNAKCGDGIVAGTETCDDRNLFSGDGCDSSCQVETNTHHCALGPQGYSVCTPICGDGRIAPGEMCDCGGGVTNCQGNALGCYNCQVSKGYVCASGAPTTDCRFGVCGDGFRDNFGYEGCDDGNLNPFDMCGWFDPDNGDVEYCRQPDRTSVWKYAQDPWLDNNPCATKIAPGPVGCQAGWSCAAAKGMPTPPYPPTPINPPNYDTCSCTGGWSVTMCGTGTSEDPNVCVDLGTVHDCTYCGHSCPTINNACGPVSGTTWARSCYINSAHTGYYCGC